MSALRWTRNRI